MKKINRYVITEDSCFVKSGSPDEPGKILISEHNFERIDDFAATRKYSVMQKITLPDGREALKPTRYVGIVMLKDGTQIEILPRIRADFEDNVVASKMLILYMLDAIKEIPVKKVDERYFKKEQLNLFEICVRMYADDVLNVIQGGLKQTYVPYRGNEMFVKGKTIYSEHAKKNFAHKEKFFCEYDVFSVDRAENRLMKKALEMLNKLSSNNLNKKQLNMLIMALDEVDASKNISNDFKQCTGDRGMVKYFKVMKWCKLFMQNNGTTFFTGGKVKYAMLFHMDKLFSACIASSLRKQLDRGNYYFLTPEKISNSISNTGMDKDMRPISDFYIKNRLTENTINVTFKFKDIKDYNGPESENTVLVFPITQILNTTFNGIGKTMYLIDLNDIDSSVSVLTETFFV
ncbi:MAG: hypothetical protein J1F11_00975 [Oscillospiraceae bacterium]|nr:hypothetical protein [Oscillospiraceae bacterium]